MAGALGASAAFRPATRAARVFLERNPYVPWEAQRPAFAHPAFTGVVHPHLPHWGAPADDSPPGEKRPRDRATPRDEATDAAEFDLPAEPTSASRSWLPRVARLGPMEARALPETHVQTVSASWCHDAEDARALMRAAADAGASVLLCVSGDGGRGDPSSLDALALLRHARALRDAGEIEPDVRLACAANPCLEALHLLTPLATSRNREASVSPSSLLAAKLEAGAEMVITQPSIVPSLARLWRREIQESGVARDAEHVAGLAIPTSTRSAKKWARLVFGDAKSRADAFAKHVTGTNTIDTRAASRHACFSETESLLRASIRAELLDGWRAMERGAARRRETDPRDARAFQTRWIEERAELAAAEILTSRDFPARGAHVMPVTPAGYRSAAALADAIRRLL